jgi:hypothetical protein
LRKRHQLLANGGFQFQAELPFIAQALLQIQSGADGLLAKHIGVIPNAGLHRLLLLPCPDHALHEQIDAIGRRRFIHAATFGRADSSGVGRTVRRD